MENDEIEQNLPGEETNRSHYDDTAYDRLRGYQTPWGKMKADGCRVTVGFLLNRPQYCFLHDISGHIDDFCIYWIHFWPWPMKDPPIKIASYPKPAGADYKLWADLKISTPDLEFQTSINEASTWNFINYLKDLDKDGLKVKDVFTKATIGKVKGKRGRSAYLITFQRENPSGVTE